jgi:hypothetical protein
MATVAMTSPVEGLIDGKISPSVEAQNPFPEQDPGFRDSIPSSFKIVST